MADAWVVDLAPDIYRQRLIIEGQPITPIDQDGIVSYLAALSDELGMTTLLEPVSHRSDRWGWAGWIHWENSGAHFYAWERPRLFFSVDIYTCKPFDTQQAIDFTRSYFHIDSVVWKTV